MEPEKNNDLTQRASPRAVLAFFIVLIVLIVGGLYVWGSQLTPSDLSDTENRVTYTNNEPETTRANADIQASAVLSSSDEVSAIEADISSTNITGADSDMDSMGAELTTFESQLR